MDSNFRDYVERVKEATDFPALVEETLPLPFSPNGRPAMVLCPFHDDRKTKSMAIYGDHAHCFGCGWHGDAITWVQETDSLSFSEAVNKLAAQAGIPRPNLTPEQRKEIQQRRDYEDALAKAAAHFAQRLQSTPEAQEYAHKRAWSDETIKSEMLGYADGEEIPPLGNRRAQDAAEALNRWAGKVGGALVYVHRSGGRVVYLAGRSINGKKHYNLPSNLAGGKRPYANALWSAHAGHVVIVEGQADAVTLAGWGFPAIALAGSGLSGSALANTLRRYARKGKPIYVIPDGDKKTNVDGLAEAAPLLRVVELPDDVGDVNDWAQKGAGEGELKELLQDAPEWLEREIARVGEIDERDRKADIQRIIARVAELDEFDRARYKGIVTETLNLPTRVYNTLLKDLLETQRRGEQQDRERQQDNRYTIEDGRLCAIEYGGWAELTKPLCNFTAEIIEDVAYDDGSGSPERKYAITGALSTGEPLPRGEVKAGSFSSLDWVHELWGARAIIRAGRNVKDQLREAIQQLSPQITSRHIYTHTGWREVGGRRVYLTGSGAVGGDDSVTVELRDVLAHYQLPNTPREVTNAMKASLRFLDVAPLEITAPLWGAMFLAPLTEIVYPDFMLWLYGESGTLKSTLSALALSHYGEFDRKTLLSWSSTSNALERACFLAKDAPVVIDDFAPQSDPFKARELKRNAGRIVRNVGNRAGRSRLRRDLSMAKTYPPRGLVISTGEQIPDGTSILARIFTLEMRPGDVDLDKLTAAQDEAHLYPHALAGYLLWLREEWDGLSRQLPDHVREYRDHVRKELLGQHLRLPGALSKLYTSCDLGITYAVATGAISQEEADELRPRIWEALVSGSVAQAQRVEQERPEKRYIATLNELLAQGKAYFEGVNGSQMLGDNTGERLGWCDKEYLYVLPAATYAAISDLLPRNGLRVKETTLRKYLEDAGILERDKNSGRRTKQLRVDGKRQRVLYLVRSKVLSEDGENGA